MEARRCDKTILLVEDSDQAQTLSGALAKSGYRVVTAKNGAEGLSAAGANRPDIIISDTVMPVMDGYRMCAELKQDKSLKDIPVILVSHLTGPEDIIRGLESGAQHYVTRPYKAEHLLSKIESLINEPLRAVNHPEDKRVEVNYKGKLYEIHAGRAQTLGLLLDTYENEMLKNRELQAALEELKSFNEKLEEKVKERTAAMVAEAAERGAAERAFRETEERFRAVVQAASDAVICLEPPDTVYLWNQKAEEMFGYAAGDAVGKPLHQLVVPERYRKRAYERLTHFFNTGEGDMLGKTVEIEAIGKDGAEFPVEVSLSAFNIRGVWNSVGIIRDITERKRLECELKQNLSDVERMNKLMVGRELKMEELRNEVRTLRERVKVLEEDRKAPCKA